MALLPSILDRAFRGELQPETVLRHSKGFDRVYLNWVREMEAVWHDVESHFNYLSQIGVIEWPDK